MNSFTLFPDIPVRNRPKNESLKKTWAEPGVTHFGSGENQAKIILSLFDYSGSWSKPYRDNGYTVIQFDMGLNGSDVRLIKKLDAPIYGILAAPPCDMFCRAFQWKEKSQDDMLNGISTVDAVIRLAHVFAPKFWALENSSGTLQDWLGEPRYKFQPWEHGDGYTKLTYLWGSFNQPNKSPVAIEMRDRTTHLNGVSRKERKSLRSQTPNGFAQAFYEANQ